MWRPVENVQAEKYLLTVLLIMSESGNSADAHAHTLERERLRRGDYCLIGFTRVNESFAPTQFEH